MPGFLASQLAIFWLSAAALSLTRLLNHDLFPDLPVKWLGYFGWFLFISSAFYLNRDRLKFALGLFVVFFFLGYLLGPFLEPPSDPFDHIYRTHSFCEKQISELPAKNRGIWQYSMNSVVICADSPTQQLDKFLEKINALNGIYWGLAVSVLFALSTSAGLPVRWAVFSVFCCFLFFGTNRFSYFGYYSFAASWTSIVIYWMWITMFFFRCNFRNTILGVLFGVISLPILWVNHYQEAAFIGFILLTWLFVDLTKWLWEFRFKGVNRDNSHKYVPPFIFRWAYVGALFLLFFVLPQSTIFKNILSGIFVANHWENNSVKVIVTWGDIHLWGKVWGHRVDDTLGMIGFLPALLAIIVFCTPLKYFNEEYPYKGKTLLVGLLPFLYLFLPLTNYIWISNVYYQAHYRICYSSIFWVTIAYFMFLSEGVLFSLVKKRCYGSDKRVTSP